MNLTIEIIILLLLLLLLLPPIIITVLIITIVTALCLKVKLIFLQVTIQQAKYTGTHKTGITYNAREPFTRSLIFHQNQRLLAFLGQ